MGKLKAILELIAASNWIVITDATSNGSVSPLYADKFIEKLDHETQRQALAGYQHNQMLSELTDDLLNPDKDIPNGTA